jgi:hypothetical protein
MAYPALVAAALVLGFVGGVAAGVQTSSEASDPRARDFVLAVLGTIAVFALAGASITASLAAWRPDPKSTVELGAARPSWALAVGP